MANKLNKIIIVDVEATCWEKEKPLEVYSDIVEIYILQKMG